MEVISEASEKNIRIETICRHIGLSVRTIQRWRKEMGLIDKRAGAKKEVTNKLTAEEKKAIIEVSCSEEFRNLTPYEIVPILAERGIYLASESTFYRVLKEHNLNKARNNTKKPKTNNHCSELVATAPNQVWSWDITYVKTNIKGKYYYLYLFMDVWSRAIVGWDIFEEESGENSSRLFKKISEEVNLAGVKLHSDNGSPMKSANMLATLHFLGVTPSFSRPGVSNDNAYSESLFKTLKYIAGYPKCFETLSDAKNWVEKFVYWYNNEHRHSAISYVTPSERHNLKDEAILEKRRNTYELAMQKNPSRWRGSCKRWEHRKTVYLNKRETTKTAKSKNELAC